tara:strand:- start:236 stop:760 length:525 start_codon:yes stop_codon:yes gene_type:complete
MIKDKLKKYKNRFRLIIVYTNNYENKDYIKSKKLYKKNIVKFHKRYVKFITYKSSKNSFKIELFGFDGKLKKKYKNMDVKKILKDIEKMPMGHIRNENLSLYEDYKPETTIKNLGFKNKLKAIYTINKIKNKSLKYQKSVINTMYNRAKYHPNRTKDMEKAMQVFKKWLNKNSN